MTPEGTRPTPPSETRRSPTDDPDGVPVRVAEVVGLRLRVAIDMTGPDPEAARVRVRAALEGAGLTWRQEGVEPYADIPAVTTPARSR